MCESMRFDGFWALCLLHGPRFRRGAVGDLRANPVAASLYEAINEGYLESEIRERSLKPRHIRCLVQAGITSVQKARICLLCCQIGLESYYIFSFPGCFAQLAKAVCSH
jgi:hypothetical protein